MVPSEEELRDLGHDVDQRAAGSPCGCDILFDQHWNFRELDALRRAGCTKQGSFLPLALSVVLRDPLERLASEFLHLGSNRYAIHQDQWDYAWSCSSRQPFSAPY